MSNFRLICGTDESQKVILNLDFVEWIELKDGDVVFSCKDSIMYFKTDLTKIEQVRYLLNNQRREEDLYFTNQRLLELLNSLRYPIPELGVVNIKGECKLGAKEPTKEVVKYQPKTKEELKELCEDLSVHLGDIDTSLIDDMSYLFFKSKRKDFSGIEKWNVSNVKDMERMFHYTKHFNEPIGGWDVSNVGNMDGMFCGAESFNQPLNSWDVSNVENMSGMFYQAKSFNQPLDSWDVSNVENMSSMFFKAESFNQPLNSWDVRKVKDMVRMFWKATSFNQPLNNWNVSNVVEMWDMFRATKSFNQDLNSWDVSECIDMDFMFQDAEAFEPKNAKWYFVNEEEYRLKTNNQAKNPAKYQPKTKEELKELCDDLSIHLGDIDTSYITNMSWLFRQSTRTNKQFEGIETWDVSNVEDMYAMFFGAKSFNQPLNNWDVSSVRNMNSMFQHASSFNQPLDQWNVSNVENMSQMFWGANLFNQDLNSWSMDIRADTFAMFEDAEAMDIKNAMWYFMKGD